RPGNRKGVPGEESPVSESLGARNAAGDLRAEGSRLAYRNSQTLDRDRRSFGPVDGSREQGGRRTARPFRQGSPAAFHGALRPVPWREQANGRPGSANGGRGAQGQPQRPGHR